jgi:mannose-1-phosphate guanylyltransferase
MAAGLGTRLRPLTDATPKCLIEIGGRPLIDYWVEALERLGVPRAVMNTHHLHEQVRAYIESSNAGRSIRLEESYEPTLLGSAGTIANNASLCDEADACLIIYADNLSTVPLPDMLAFHASHADPFTMLVFRAAEPRRCGIAECDANGRIVGFEEKPANPKSNLANAGVYIVDRDAYREIAAMNAFDIGFDVLPRFVGRMRAWAWDGYHRDIGTHESLAAAREDVKAWSAHAG